MTDNKKLSTAERVKAALKTGTPAHFSVQDRRSEAAQSGYIKPSTRIIGDIDELKSCYARMIARMAACPKPDDWNRRHGNKPRAPRPGSGWLDFVNHRKTPVIEERFPSKVVFNANCPPDLSPWFYINPFAWLTDLNPFERYAGERVVSKQLRAVIEELEPGMAQFFPVSLQFSDRIVEGYSWMPEKSRFFDGLSNDRTDIDRPAGEAVVSIQGDPLKGSHWGFWTRWQYIFSAEMLARLQPLMPLREFNLLSIQPVVQRKRGWLG